MTFDPTRARAFGPTMQAGVEKEDVMRVRVGDRIVVRGHRVGDPDRECEVLEVKGDDGGSPYIVRWGFGGHETLFFPGPDATVEHVDHASK